MKSEYRCLVEAIICSEQKLREAKSLQRDAQEKLNQANGFVSCQEASLRESEQRLVELESKMLGQEPQDLQKELKEINASLKLLCREVMRPGA
ncbi:TPA: hypothetical protein QEM72_004398 [Pseudomonas putida]|uniref:hypothetical protein n=1 Tax=Pseudomonas putida TaxID=303 RepID=UPI002363E6F8|nr:hypothetical protein [Pseudomonas putida]MDD2077090.1 hypothetical protein [Pseudomonas putida]HDS1693814.1 hypothetical protein [Pseudomonas putida]